MWADEELVGKINFESIVCHNVDIDKTFFVLKDVFEKKRREYS